MAFEPAAAAAAEKAEEQATGEEAGENASAALAKWRQFKSEFRLLHYHFYCFFLVSDPCLVKTFRTTMVESKEEEEEGAGDGGDDDNDDDDDMVTFPSASS